MLSPTAGRGLSNPRSRHLNLMAQLGIDSFIRCKRDECFILPLLNHPSNVDIWRGGARGQDLNKFKLFRYRWIQEVVRD